MQSGSCGCARAACETTEQRRWAAGAPEAACRPAGAQAARLLCCWRGAGCHRPVSRLHLSAAVVERPDFCAAGSSRRLPSIMAHTGSQQAAD